MSELKWNWAYYPYLDPPEKQAESALKAGYIKVVNKDEADKAIAELKDNLGTVNQIVKASRELLLESQKMHKRCAENAAKIIRHQKYKRCLAMAEMCNARYNEEDEKVNGCGASWDYTSKEMKYWERWEMRWLELAEKFKEAK